MNDLERWASGTPSVIPSREERQHKKAVDNLVRETRFTGLKVDAEAALTARVMERAVDNTYRRSLSNGDPVLDAVLAKIEMGYVEKAVRIQRQFGSEFPL